MKNVAKNKVFAAFSSNFHGFSRLKIVNVRRSKKQGGNTI